MKNKKKIIISGGEGNLAKEILKQNSDYEILAPSKSDLNILDKTQLHNYLKIENPDFFLHSAALTRPMNFHAKYPEKSVETNIVGTSNVVLECIKNNIKLVYISTDYVYPGICGNYKEEDSLGPFCFNNDGLNKYGWSKLGGECAVRIYDNSLIIRLCLCQKPFPHLQAPTDVFKSYIYTDEAAKLVLQVLDLKGVINIGGERQSIYDFASKDNPNIKKISKKDINDVCLAPDTSMNIKKLKFFLRSR